MGISHAIDLLSLQFEACGILGLWASSVYKPWSHPLEHVQLMKQGLEAMSRTFHALHLDKYINEHPLAESRNCKSHCSPMDVIPSVQHSNPDTANANVRIQHIIDLIQRTDIHLI